VLAVDVAKVKFVAALQVEAGRAQVRVHWEDLVGRIWWGGSGGEDQVFLGAFLLVMEDRSQVLDKISGIDI